MMVNVQIMLFRHGWDTVCILEGIYIHKLCTVLVLGVFVIFYDFFKKTFYKLQIRTLNYIRAPLILLTVGNFAVIVSSFYKGGCAVPDHDFSVSC